jgi:hypothetical protein
MFMRKITHLLNRAQSSITGYVHTTWTDSVTPPLVNERGRPEILKFPSVLSSHREPQCDFQAKKQNKTKKPQVSFKGCPPHPCA